MMRTLAKLTWVEMKLFSREPITVIFSLAFPLVMLVVLAGVFGNEVDPDFRDAIPVDYYVPGYLAIVIASIGLIGLPVHLAAYRERGILRRFRASSVSPWSLFAAQVTVSFVIAAFGSVLLVVAAVVIYDAQLPESPARLLLAFVISTLSFVSLGFLIGTLLASARAAQAVGLLLFLPMWLLSGAGPPREVMGGAMRTISDVLPLTYVVTSLQDAWLGLGSSVIEILVLTGVILVAGALSVRFARSV
jgi:ABC-2 type transport system permease protein